MVRFVSQSVRTRIQVLNSSGDPATSAVVGYRILDPEDGVLDSGSMTHISNGIYGVDWTPSDDGPHTFEAWSDSPRARDALYNYSMPPLDFNGLKIEWRLKGSSPGSNPYYRIRVRYQTWEKVV